MTFIQNIYFSQTSNIPFFLSPMVLRLGILSFAFILLMVSCGEKKSELFQIQDLYIPEVLIFAGDTIPIEDQEIRERLERELWINMYWQSNTAQWIKKSGRWFPLIDSILKSNQIPEDFKYLVAIESGFENVSSNKGAVGFWQLMEPTAKEFGLIVNSEIDQRLDPMRSGVAACLLLKRGKTVLGNWASVAASYNIGITGLKRVMDTQYTNSYYDILVNQETGRYLFRILAAKLILTHPEKYGFGKIKAYPQWRIQKKVLDTSILDLAYWCRNNGFSYKCFRLVNPWIKANTIHLNDSISQLEISIPLDCKTYTTTGLPAKIRPLVDSSLFAEQAVFQNLVNTKDMNALKTASLVKYPKFHEVRDGENLSLIASKYKIKVSTLYLLNPGLGKNQNKITKGLKLRILK